MATVLVTGSEGTLGERLVSALWSRGHNVFCVDLAHSARDHYRRADVANFRQLEEAFMDAEADFGPVDYVYHLAAEFGRNNGELYYEQVWATNAIGTRNVMQLCKYFGSKMVFASSSEVYGEKGFAGMSSDGNWGIDDFLREPHLDDQVPELTNEYAISKYTNELQIRNFVKRYELPVCVLRFFNAYGPGEHYHPFRSVVCLFVHSALHGKPWDVYEGYFRTFMHVDDFIPTLARVIDGKRDGTKVFPQGVYNVGGRDFRSVEELSEIVLRETGASPSLARFVGREKHNVVSKRPDISRAEQDLGHDPKITLEQGIPDTVAWMRSQLGRKT